MKKTIMIFASVLTILLLVATGCQPRSSEGEKEEMVEEMAEEMMAEGMEMPSMFDNPDYTPVIALIRKVGEGSFFERQLAGAQLMADQLGVELRESNARGDDARMVTAVETAVQQNVDAIIISHGQPTTLEPVIEAAQAKGIHVVSFDTVVDNPLVPEIEQDDLFIGFTLSKKLAVDFGGNANVIYVNVGGFAALDKRGRVWEVFKWRYPNLNEVAQIGAVTDNTAADTLTRMEAALKEHSDVDAVIAMWDEFAKGAVNAIKQSGIANPPKVYSVDISNENIQLMIEPNSPWEATVATDSFNVGRLAVRTAAAMVGGEKIAKYLLINPAVITRDFLLENNITNMDELVAALPELGESDLVWPDWIKALVGDEG